MKKRDFFFFFLVTLAVFGDSLKLRVLPFASMQKPVCGLAPLCQQSLLSGGNQAASWYISPCCSPALAGSSTDLHTLPLLRPNAESSVHQSQSLWL